MSRFFTCYWRNQYWNDQTNRADEPIQAAGSNKFFERGVRRGDLVFIISQKEGVLLLGGRMVVDRTERRELAVELMENPNLYDECDEWVLGSRDKGTPLRLERELAPDVTRQLLFETSDPTKPQPLKFTSGELLDTQTTRGVRELTEWSGKLLDQVIRYTDMHFQGPVVVTEDILRQAKAANQAIQPWSIKD